MFPGLNPKKMQAMMRQMGMAQEEINASQVIIKTDEENIIINNPSVIKIKMQGQENFQISGDIITSSKSEDSGGSKEDAEEQEEIEENNSEEDIQTIIEKTECSGEEAKKALEKANNDLTEALLNLS